ncbi:MAG: fimbrial protein [Aeromonadaceae bacterium]
MRHVNARFILQLLLFWSVAQLAHASCQWDGPPLGTTYNAVNDEIDVNMINTSIGSRLSDIGGIDGSPSWQTKCNGGESAGYTNLAGSTVPALSSEKGPVYNISALPGIGYSVSGSSLYGSPNYFMPYGSVQAPAGGYSFDASAKLRLDFWRTGPLTTGHYCLPPGTTLGYVKFDNLTVASVVMSNGLCANVVGPTCTVSTDSTNISVPLGNQSISQFTGIGSSSLSRGFNINLDSCSNVKAVLMQFNATPDGDYANAAQQGVIQLQNVASKATGIGVQLLKGDNITPVPLNSQQSMWQGSSTPNISLPFAVRYLQTRSTVTPGEANALAQFVVAYQ